ncbi:monosaccharide ABC transporter substrate-binding protein, CUT2 family [Demequina mangrovi]|uniref:Monosaccharide ABC transporter substrate-binding protein, CUT2 family n=1 Tax=Demequina mangrovi TaxID=1043493 RepID=A0A1H6W088_9MICO|nr:monosaccharide ABC transporter substrate-binding protein, CUT2 family [Demequina mangrovi]
MRPLQGKGNDVKKSSLISTGALLAASALVLAGCSSDSGSDDGSSGGSSAGSSDDGAMMAEGGRACIILPDAASSPRWENGDRPALDEAITAAGFEADIQNAQGDTAKYSTIADQMLTQGCGVMILVDYNGAAVTITENAQAQGIPVIAYDRPIAGADYYVSFDNFQVGELEGQSVVDGLEANGVDPAEAVVVYIGGDPADGNAAMFHDGAVSVMEAAGIEPAAEPAGKWDGEYSATQFEQALTDLGGKVDAVWAANDTNAAGVITVLDKNGLTVPVSGQDASVAGLQNVLLGKQAATVYKPYQLEAATAAELAVALLGGEAPEAPTSLDDGTPFFAETPILVGPEDVQQVIDDGNASYDEICTGDVLAACDEVGLQPAS